MKSGYLKLAYLVASILRLGLVLVVGVMVCVMVMAGCSNRKKGSVVATSKQAATIPASKITRAIENNPFFKGSSGEAEVVIAEGKAQILEAGEQVAYERAKEHALRNAVEMALGTWLLSQTSVVDDKLIRDAIYAESSGFVEKYQIIGEQNSNDVKKLKIRAWVVLREIENTWLTYRILQERAGLPRVAVWVNHASALNIKNHAPKIYKTIETSLTKALLAKQFLVVDQNLRKKIHAATKSLPAAPANENKQAYQKNTYLLTAAQQHILAEQGAADIVIEVSVNAYSNDLKRNKYLSNRSFHSMTADVSVKTYYLNNGYLIYAGSEVAKMLDLNQGTAAVRAAEKALAVLEPRLIAELLRYWDRRINEGSRYELVMTQLDFADSILIKERLSSRYLEGIVTVVDRGFAIDTQTFTVVYTGKIAELTRFILAREKIPVSLALQSYTSTRAIFIKQ
ncbi:hypothetical protein COTS27_01332 [Spirochaetota bacterium]|nr:hypothetical protein COTS27_01332 [Spirochaetota bacterium]